MTTRMTCNWDLGCWLAWLANDISPPPLLMIGTYKCLGLNPLWPAVFWRTQLKNSVFVYLKLFFINMIDYRKPCWCLCSNGKKNYQLTPPTFVQAAVTVRLIFINSYNHYIYKKKTFFVTFLHESRRWTTNVSLYSAIL